MEKNVLKLKVPAKAFMAEILKELLLCAVVLCFSLIGANLKQNIFSKHKIETILFSIFDVPMKEVVIVLIINIIFLILAVCIIRFLYRCVSMFYKYNTNTIIYPNEFRFRVQSLKFPFTRLVEEGTINQVIEVDITQNLVQKLLCCGNLDIEYLVYSKTGARVKNLYIYCVDSPEKEKLKLLAMK